VLIIEDYIDITSEKGSILKSTYSLNINNKTTTLRITSSNILKEETEYKKIKTEDIVGINSRDSGFQSLRAIIIGIVFLIVGIQLISSLGGINIGVQISFAIGVLLILYGIQQTFEIDVHYQSLSQTLPLAISGVLNFEGTGQLPIQPQQLVQSLFGSPNEDIFSVETKDGFLGVISYRRKLRVTDTMLVIDAEKSQLTPSSVIGIPLKNIISINVTPSSFRNFWVGLLGILIAAGGVFAVLGGSLFSGILSTILGVVFAFYGFGKLMKTEFTYAITGKTVKSVVLEGEIIRSSHDVEQMGEIIMGAITRQQSVVEEVAAK